MSILVSIAAQLLFPVANILRGAAAAIPATTAAATTTAASMVGSRVLKAANRPDQLDEADVIALRLLRHAGRDLEKLARSADELMPKLAKVGDEGWVTEFRVSKEKLDQLDCGVTGIALATRESLASAGGDSEPEIALRAESVLQ